MINVLADRLRNFTIYVGNNDGPSTPFDPSTYQVCAYMCHNQTKRRRYYTCNIKLYGRHVAVWNDVDILSLCELEVYVDNINSKEISFQLVLT